MARLGSFLITVTALLSTTTAAPSGPSPVEQRAATVTPGGTGPYPAIYTTDPTLTKHTIYQPAIIPPDLKLPDLVWANGGCIASGTGFEILLTEIASYGIFIIADGGISGIATESASYLTEGITWATKYGGQGDYTYVVPSRLAAAGQSCGGLEAYDVESNPAVTAIGIFDSGEFTASSSKSTVGNFTKPIFYFQGGSTDLAYKNGLQDYSNLPKTLPAWIGNLEIDGKPAGHVSTYFDTNGGIAAKAAVNYFQWVLRGNQTASTYFTSNATVADGWVVESQNLGSINVPAI